MILGQLNYLYNSCAERSSWENPSQPTWQQLKSESGLRTSLATCFEQFFLVVKALHVVFGIAKHKQWWQMSNWHLWIQLLLFLLLCIDCNISAALCSMVSYSFRNTNSKGRSRGSRRASIDKLFRQLSSYNKILSSLRRQFYSCFCLWIAVTVNLLVACSVRG